MRALAFFILMCLLSGVGFAQEKVVQTFQGSGALTTSAFQVQDKWEVRWESKAPLAVTVLSSDGTVVAGASAWKGSLYLPKGGSFYLQVDQSGSSQERSWAITVVEVGTGTVANGQKSPIDYIPPQLPPAPPANTIASTAAPSSPAPPSVPAAATPPANPAPASSIDDLAHAVVVIKGDVAEGTGFLVHTAEGPAVVTNLHVISANPNIRILTTTGEQIKTLSLKGASDRDLAMFMIQDNHYTYLDLATDIRDTVQTGDEVITPGNSEGGEVVLDTKGTVLGIGPERVEFSNPIYHGNSGGPVFHTKSGKVLAVVTQAMKVDISNAVDKASHDNKNSAISGAMRYFGLRVDTVPKWEPYEWSRFLNETTFLKEFHDQSRCLDSFMNGAGYEKAHVVSTDEFGHPDSHYYLKNDKIQTASDTYHKLTVDTDKSQQLDAVRELIMDLEGLADADMPAIQNPANFYSFDALRAEYEIKYRKALRAEIDNIGGKVSDLGH